MYPTLFRLGLVSISSYRLFLALSFLAGTFVAIRIARKEDVTSSMIAALSLIIFVASLVGSKLFYLVFHWAENAPRMRSELSAWVEGSSVWGAFILSILAVVLYVKYKGTNVWKVLDILSPPVAISIFIGRIGCFMNGCCFGLPTKTWIGIVFPLCSPAGSVFPNTMIYPTQIFLALHGLVIFMVLMWLKKSRKFMGFIFCTMLFLYSIGRFIVDFFRYYESKMTLISIKGHYLSTSQVFSIIVMIMSIILYWFLFQRSKKAVGVI